MEAGRPKEGTVKLPQVIAGESREKAAAQVGVNPRYVSDAKKIKEADPEVVIAPPVINGRFLFIEGAPAGHGSQNISVE